MAVVTEEASLYDDPGRQPRRTVRRRRPRLLRRRVPFVHADTLTECGAACLTMVLRYYGRKVSLVDCHEQCGVSRDGTSARHLTTAARHYGLQATGLSVPIDGLAEVSTPAILHWNFNHFVVLEKAGPTGAMIVDPAFGRTRVSPDELGISYTGVALTFTPGPRFVRGWNDLPSPWATLGRAVWTTPQLRPLMVWVGLASLLLVAFGLVNPALTKVLVDQVLPARLDGVLTVIAFGIGFIAVTSLLASVLRALLLVNLSSRADAQLMTGFVDRLFDLPYTFFQSHSIGDLNQRVSSNSQIRAVLTQQLLNSGVDGLLVLVYSVVLLLISPAFGLLTLAIGLVQVLLLVLPARRLTLLTTRELAEVGRTGSFVIEALSAIDTVKASAAESSVKRRFSRLLTDQIDASMRLRRFGAVLGASTSSLSHFAAMLLLWFGAHQVLDGSLSLGTMLALLALSLNLLTPMTNLVQSVQGLQQVQGHMLRLATVLVAPREQEFESLPAGPRLSGRVELREVSYRYDSTAPWAVRELSVTVEPGARVAIVGPSGSGKSTVAKLLLGLVEATEGSVVYDGVDIAGVDRRSVRSQCGVVMQESMVFNGSIRDNVTLHQDEVQIDAVERAIRDAALADDVARMPMGVETIVSEGGSALSGGQRQRLGIARALARDPAVLVFDEATSHLDMLAEQEIGQNLRSRRVSTIMIAHRLSTVRDADLIVVMAEGRMVEQGTHEQLLARGGLYTELVRGQTADGSLGEGLDDR